jgi:hypothetical protein
MRDLQPKLEGSHFLGWAAQEHAGHGDFFAHQATREECVIDCVSDFPAAKGLLVYLLLVWRFVDDR